MQRTFSNEVRRERTGWRDAELSLRHRDWGYNCPAVDLDFLVVEYNFAKPVALIEYKHIGIHRLINVQHPTMRALLALAELANLPFALAYYDKNPFVFMVDPLNSKSQEWFTKWELLSEYDYVAKLYKMRGNIMALELSKILSTEIPNPYLFRKITYT